MGIQHVRLLTHESISGKSNLIITLKRSSLSTEDFNTQVKYFLASKCIYLDFKRWTVIYNWVFLQCSIAFLFFHHWCSFIVCNPAALKLCPPLFTFTLLLIPVFISWSSVDSTLVSHIFFSILFKDSISPLIKNVHDCKSGTFVGKCLQSSINFGY